jgi:hypothetical protein
METGCGAHRASYAVGSGDSLGLNRSGRETDHSRQSSADVKNGGATTPLLNTSSWRVA